MNAEREHKYKQKGAIPHCPKILNTYKITFPGNRVISHRKGAILGLHSSLSSLDYFLLKNFETAGMLARLFYYSMRLNHSYSTPTRLG